MKFHDAAQRWNHRYQESSDSSDPLFGSAPNFWLAEHGTRFSTGSDVLCIADGQGRNGLHLARCGHHVTSFDVSTVAIDYLKARASDEGLAIDARVSDIEQWPWSADQYDAVVAVYIQFADPLMRSRLFRHIATSLRSGGLLIIEGYGTRQLKHKTGGPGVAENLYRASLLAAEFPGWSVLAGRDCDIELDEGGGHSGLSHVISSVLMKPGS